MNNQSGLSEIFRYLNLIYQKRYTFLGIAMLVTTLVTGFAYSLPKKYQADSTVFIEESVINTLVKGLAVTPDMEHRIRVLKFALSSRELIAKVLMEMDSEIFTKSKSEQQKYISNLRKRTLINLREKQGFFTISLIGNDPEFVQNYINTLVGKYVEENISSKRDETYGANRFLQEQIDLFKTKLDKSEDAIIEFRKQKGVYLSLDEAAAIAGIRQYNEEIENIQLTLDALKARTKRLRSQLKTISPTVDIFTGATGSNGLVDLERKLAGLLMNYTENYPEVIRLKAQIEELKKNIKAGEDSPKSKITSMSSLNPLYQQVQQQIFDAEVEASSLQARKVNLEKRIEEREASLRDVPENRKTLGVLVQERDSNKQIYQELLARMGQSEVSKQMEISDKAATFRIVDPALFPEVPVSPNMIRMLMLALAAGFGCGFGVIFLLDLLDTSIKNPQQLEAAGVELIAIIPTIDNGLPNTKYRRRDLLTYAVTALYYTSFMILFASEALSLNLTQKLHTLINTL